MKHIERTDVGRCMCSHDFRFHDGDHMPCNIVACDCQVFVRWSGDLFAPTKERCSHCGEVENHINHVRAIHDLRQHHQFEPERLKEVGR